MSVTIFPVGTVLTLIYPLNDGKANFPCKAIVVDGPMKFPLYHQQLKSNFVLSDIEEFVAIEWDKNCFGWNGAIDGFYHSARFEIAEDQTDFRVVTTSVKVDSNIKNNEGRSRCFQCNSPTKQVMGFNSVYIICPNCKV